MIECVPNVSEGRDGHVIDALAGAVGAAGARLLDVHRDPDHHRSVLTFLGDADAVRTAALTVGRLAIERIDITCHDGVHPRLGALDVMPFVPLAGSSMRDAVELAHGVGRSLAADLGIPVFFYGEAALVPARRELPVLRSGGLMALRARLGLPGWQPDAGPADVHSTAGVAVIGARRVLIAFNAVLDTAEVQVAHAVARALRESSGGLPAVRAIGVPLASRGLAQVAMNLVDYRRTPPRVVAERLEAEARALGSDVIEYELVGCAPADAFAAPLARPIAAFDRSRLLDPALFRSEDDAGARGLSPDARA